MGRLLFAALALVLVAAPVRAQDDDYDDYMEAGVEDVLKAHPCGARAGPELQEVLFTVSARYVAGPRAASGQRLELLRRYLAKARPKDDQAAFGKEIQVSSGKGSWWALVNATLLDSARKDVGQNQTTTFFFTFIGCSDGEPVLLIDSILTPEDEPDDSSYIV